jgi:hypothetical protein
MVETIELDLPADKIRVSDSRLKTRVLHVQLEGRTYGVVYDRALIGNYANLKAYHDIIQGVLFFSGTTEPTVRRVTVMIKN